MMLYTLVWRNSFRHKMRFTLTVLSVVVAFFLLTSLAAINTALTARVSAINQHRLMTSHKMSIARSLPIHYQQKIAALAGVQQVTYASWFAGFFQHEKNQLAVTAVEHNSYFQVFSEYSIAPSQLQQWQNTRAGIIVGDDIAKHYGWKVGDSVPLSSSIWMNKKGSFTWQFIVSGIYHTGKRVGDNNKIFFQHAYFDQGRAYTKNSLSWLSTQISSQGDVDQVSQAIDQLFTHTNNPTTTTTEQVFIKEQAQQFVDMAMVINVVAAAVFFTLLLIVCNTMIQVVRERLNETAMMLVLGFPPSALVNGIFLEAFLLLSVGALVGSVSAQLIMVFVQQAFADFLPGIAIPTQHYVLVLALVNLCAMLCALFPAIVIKGIVISKRLGSQG